MGAGRGRRLRAGGRLPRPDLQRPRRRGLDVPRLHALGQRRLLHHPPAAGRRATKTSCSTSMTPASAAASPKKRRRAAAAKAAAARSRRPPAQPSAAAPPTPAPATPSRRPRSQEGQEPTARSTTNAKKHNKNRKHKHRKHPKAKHKHRKHNKQKRATPTAGGPPKSRAPRRTARRARAARCPAWRSASPAPAEAAFGVKSLQVSARNADGSVDNRAGSHPYEYVVRFEVNTDAEGEPEGSLRNLIVDLPAGMTGNPLALPRCSGADFEGGRPRCPGNTQVGVAQVKLGRSLRSRHRPRLQPRPAARRGRRARGLSIANINSFQEASLRPSDYGVRISDITIPTDKKIVLGRTRRSGGCRCEASHDPERFCPVAGSPDRRSKAAPAKPPPAGLPHPADLLHRAAADARSRSNRWRNRASWSARAPSRSAKAAAPKGCSGCDRPPFAPTISSQPETAAAESPSGLDFAIHVPQASLSQIPRPPGDPEGNATATATLRDAAVTLPAGLAVNPSAAAGLAACSPAQIGLGRRRPSPRCPAASALGTVKARTPLLDHPLPGTVYLAAQGDNPFGSLIAIYIVVDDPVSGVVVKLAGKVEPDPVTGQLRTPVAQNPQLPFEDLALALHRRPARDLHHAADLRHLRHRHRAGALDRPRRARPPTPPTPSRSAPRAGGGPARTAKPRCPTPRPSKPAPRRRWPAPSRPSS